MISAKSFHSDPVCHKQKVSLLIANAQTTPGMSSGRYYTCFRQPKAAGQPTAPATATSVAVGLLVLLLASQALVLLMMDWQTRSAARDGHMRPEPLSIIRSYRAHGHETRFCGYGGDREAVCSQSRLVRVLKTNESVV